MQHRRQRTAQTPGAAGLHIDAQCLQEQDEDRRPDAVGGREHGHQDQGEQQPARFLLRQPGDQAHHPFSLLAVLPRRFGAHRAVASNT